MKKIILGALVVLIIYSLLFWRNSQKFEITPEGGIIEEKREIMPNDSIDSLNRGRIPARLLIRILKNTINIILYFTDKAVG